MSLAMAVVGVTVDRIKWPAIVAGVIALLLCLLVFGWPLFSMLCS